MERAIAMAATHDLAALTREIAVRETSGDAAWFDRVLAPEFVMRRALGVHVGRAVFLAAVAPGAERQTSDVRVLLESDRSAVVTCMVSMRQVTSRFQTEPPVDASSFPHSCPSVR